MDGDIQRFPWIYLSTILSADCHAGPWKTHHPSPAKPTRKRKHRESSQDQFWLEKMAM